VLRWR